MLAKTASFILLIAAFGTGAVRLQDDPLVDKVKQIVAKVDSTLAANGKDELPLPNILPFDAVKLTNGFFGNFSTIEVQGEPFVNQTQLDDGSSVYSFEVELGLKELQVRYDFKVSIVAFNQEGNFSLSVEHNTANLIGAAIVHADQSCEAQLRSIRVVECDDYKIDLEPNDIPYATEISELILNFVTPLMLPVTNKAIQAALSGPLVQEKFSGLVCQELAK